MIKEKRDTFISKEDYLKNCRDKLIESMQDCHVVRDRRKFFSIYELIVTPIYPRSEEECVHWAQVLFENRMRGTTISRFFVFHNKSHGGGGKLWIRDVDDQTSFTKLPKEVLGEIMKMTR